MLSQLTRVVERRGSNRALTRLRALLRSNELYLIPLALVVGVVAGAVVTLMSELAQIAHVLIYGIPIDVRLSANAYVKPMTALIAPACGGLAWLVRAGELTPSGLGSSFSSQWPAAVRNRATPSGPPTSHP